MQHTRRLPNLSVLRAVEATVRLGSVSRAAQELHLTDGAVSRAVRDLEATLGFSLFQRRNRMVVATSTAETLAEEIAEHLAGLQNALERASRRKNSKTLVLSCEPTFLIRWLIPRLGALQALLNGERELRLVSAGGAVAFARDGIDLAIRRNDFPLGKDILARTFLQERVGPVCRPEHMAHMQSPLQHDVLLHTDTRPDAWSHWSTLSGMPLQARQDIHFEHFYLSLQAALAGAGVAIGPIALVSDDITSGALVAPYGFIADGTEYMLMASAEGEEHEIFEMVLNWLTEAAQETERNVLSAVDAP